MAVVADFLTTKAGGERVVLAMMAAFPHARLVTSMYEPDATFPEFRAYQVETTWVNNLPSMRRDLRRALPLLGPAFRGLRLDEDIVLCSSAGWSHFVRARGAKVVYCHNPPRWLHQEEDYFRGLPPAARAVTGALGPYLRRADREGARSASRYFANSTAVQQRIARVYGRESEVLHPPVGLAARMPLTAMAGIEPGYLLTVARSRGYKNVALAKEAARVLGRRLVVVGGAGSERDALVTTVHDVSDSQLAWLYRHASALVACAHEDFGLTPIEANTFGTPVLAWRAGGYLDTVVDGVNGFFFDELTPTAIAEAVRRLDAHPLDETAIRDRAGRFSSDVFAAALRHRVLADVRS